VDLDIRHLQLVAGIARDGSMTKAASGLHVTQSALSHQLRDIESRFNTPFFLRVGKRMVLTAAGRRVLAHLMTVSSSNECWDRRVSSRRASRSSC
jgi:LysR family transcriptional regulator, regulator for metE and metH